MSRYNVNYNPRGGFNKAIKQKGRVRNTFKHPQKLSLIILVEGSFFLVLLFLTILAMIFRALECILSGVHLIAKYLWLFIMCVRKWFECLEWFGVDIVEFSDVTPNVWDKWRSIKEKVLNFKKK